MIDHQPNGLQENTTDGQSPDVLGGLLKVLNDPTRAEALSDILRMNPVRFSMDPADPSVVLRTNSNGTVERGQVTDDGQFVPAGRVGLRGS
ncbi:hypothetical protein LJR129_004141 [Acidovorax sp. LjRoot129]|uniref:hypothetical protein n=1 Tax=Acidovorax sp. LjRoot129 TaxID=3342260 RepID=UPI003ECF4084